MIKVNKLIFFSASRYSLKEIENIFPVFLSSYRNTRESLGELEKAVKTLVCGYIYEFLHLDSSFCFLLQVILLILNLWALHLLQVHAGTLFHCLILPPNGNSNKVTSMRIRSNKCRQFMKPLFSYLQHYRFYTMKIVYRLHESACRKQNKTAQKTKVRPLESWSELFHFHANHYFVSDF